MMTKFLIALAGLAVCEAAHGEAPALQARPNILFIVVDDLNDEVGFLGDTHAITPNMDRLAAQSAVFENTHCQAPICGPSRNSFLTGKHPHNTGLYGLDPMFRDVPELSDRIALPQNFRQQGYTSIGVGKVFHSKPDPLSFDNKNPGWFGGYGPFPDKPIRRDPDQGFHQFFDWGPYLEDVETADHKIAEYAIRQIEEAARKQTPYFLAVGFFRPHTPLYAPKKWFDLHPLEAIAPVPDQSNDLTDLPAYALKLVNLDREQKWHQWLHTMNYTAEFLQAYRACVSYTDHNIGKLLDALDKTGLDKNTIVVMAGDQGMQNGSKNLWWKRTLWEQTTRVPLLIKVPGQPHRRIKSPVGLVDLYPTLCKLAGLSAPADLDGLSLVDLMKGSPGAENRPPAVISHGPGNFAVRDLRWNYIHYTDGSEELYDHDTDPAERHNLAANAESAVVIARLKRFVPEKWADFAPGTKGFDCSQFPGK